MTWQVDSSGIGRGSVTLDGIVGYNGAWDSSWGSTSSRSAYAGRNKYYTVIKFTISADYNNGSGSGWIAVAANLLSNVNSQTNYNRTLSFGLSKTAPTLGSSTVGLPSSFIGGAKSKVFTVNNQSKKSWFQIGDQNSPISFSSDTYYLWVWSASPSEIGLFYQGSSYYSASAAMFAYTACGAPTYFSAATSNIKYNDDIKVQWRGATAGVGQSITGYEILYKYGNYPTSSSYDGRATTSAAATSLTISTPFKSSTSNRGKTAYFIIRTLCSNSSYYSNFRRCNNTVKCNSLPVIDELVLSKQNFSSTESISPTVTISASDIDRQSIAYYYQKSGSSTKTNFKSGDILPLSAGTYYFYAYDGKEYSNSWNRVITKNTAPKINSIQYNLTTISNYLSGGNIKATVNKSNNGSCTCILKSGDSEIKTYKGTLNGSTFTFTINISDLSNITTDTIINGVEIEYIDNYGEKASKSERLPTSAIILGSNNINSLKLSANLESDISDTTLNSTYFNKTFNYTIETNNNTDFIQSKTLNLYNTYDNKSYNFNFGTAINLDYSLPVYNGLKFIPKVTLRDLYGREIVKTLPTTIIKIIPISFNSNESISVSLKNFKPLTTTPSGYVKISFPATHITFNGEVVNSNNLDKILEFNLYFSDTNYSTSTSKSLDGSTLEVSFEASDFNKIWNSLYKSQKENGSTVTINPTLKVVDILGNISEGRSTENFIIDYNEAPEFGGNQTIILFHEKIIYDTVDKVNSKISNISNLPETSPSDSDNKINSGEILVIKHPIAKDKNVANSLSYNILATFLKDTTQSEFSIISINNYLELCKTFTDSTYMYWVFLVKKGIQLCNIENIKVEVTDGSNKIEISSAQTLQLFPMENFNFKCTSCNFTIEEKDTDTDYDKILINANFEVSNISGYSDYYKYKNLERKGENNFSNSKLEIYYSQEVDTLNSDLSKIAELPLNSDTFPNINEFSDLSNFSLSSYKTDKSAEFKGYFRFKLILNYGINSNDNDNDKDIQKDVWSDIFFFENLEPTVSYRQNSIAINHKIKDGDLIINENNIKGELYQSAFSVYSTKNYSKIYLVNNENSSQRIIINLTNGSIDGATISGGEW